MIPTPAFSFQDIRSPNELNAFLVHNELGRGY